MGIGVGGVEISQFLELGGLVGWVVAKRWLKGGPNPKPCVGRTSRKLIRSSGKMVSRF